jgi:Protein of unknown function (DUF2934)
MARTSTKRNSTPGTTAPASPPAVKPSFKAQLARPSAPALQAKAPASSARPSIDRQQVALHAFLIWERKGRPAGTEMENWLEAERELSGSAAA